MNIPFRSFTDSVRDMSVAVTASAGKLVDVSVGSILRAIIEANASVVLWVQWLIFLTLQTTRASTSTDTDLDSWMADFSLSRLPAVAATGTVTFHRLSGTAAASIPIGTMVKTRDGSMTFTVMRDLSNPAWHPDPGTYMLDMGVLSISLQVRATVPGKTGNVRANTITLIASSIPGIDSVSNETEMTGGGEAEADDQFRARFQNFFSARSKGTVDAIGYAVSQVKRDLNYVIQENTDAVGRSRIGTVLVVADDGSGILPENLSGSLMAAIETVRPIGTVISIQPPTIIPVQVEIVMECPPDIPVDQVRARVSSSVRDYINKRLIGRELSISRISQLIYQTEANIINISRVRLNGQGDDLIAPSTAVFKFQSMVFH